MWSYTTHTFRNYSNGMISVYTGDRTYGNKLFWYNYNPNRVGWGCKLWTTLDVVSLGFAFCKGNDTAYYALLDCMLDNLTFERGRSDYYEEADVYYANLRHDIESEILRVTTGALL